MYVAWTANGATVRGTLSTKLPLSTWARYEVRITAAGAGDEQHRGPPGRRLGLQDDDRHAARRGIATLRAGDDRAARARRLLAEDPSARTP